MLGEASKQVSPELQEAHPEIPWRKVADFRNLAVHEYRRINLKKVWRISQDDLPSLVEKLAPIIPPEAEV